MPPRSTEAFVLDAVPMRERDKVVILLTEGEGKIRGVAHGAARSSRRFGGRLERLNRVNVTYFEKEGQDLVRIDDLELVAGSFRLHKDIRVAAALGYIAEMANEFSREKEADQRFYRLVGATVEGLRAGIDVDLLMRYFEFWTARLHGIFPALEACDACRRPFGAAGARLAVGEGAALCGRCAETAGGRSLPLHPTALTVLSAFRKSAPGVLANLAVPPAALREVEAAATAALEAFAGHELRSRAFLRQAMKEEIG